MRGLTLARAMPWHEFLFVANDDAPAVLEPEFRVTRLPNLGTKFRNYRVDMGATIKNALPLLLNAKKWTDAALKLIDAFKPDVCMTDLEFFVPRAAKKAGLPCLTLDHQHVITMCRHDLPPDMRWDAFIQGLTPRWLFWPTGVNIIISFYSPPLLPGYNAVVMPPILREKTISRRPSNGDHILVYQSNSTDTRLIDFLHSATGRTAHVFGYRNRRGKDGNIIFHKKDEDTFLDLLADCAYVIQGGSHTLMGEALYFGKPVISLPIKAMAEQRFNALYLERLGYGVQAGMRELDTPFLERFENNLEKYRANVAAHCFLGNTQVFAMVDEFARTGQINNLSRRGPA